jgi:type IV pilus assembly protein PilM
LLADESVAAPEATPEVPVSLAEESAAVPEPAKVPWYKRELSLGGKKKPPAAVTEEPVSAAAAIPAVELPPVTAAPVEVPMVTAAPAKLPWYKRELSLKPKSKSAPPPQSAEPVEAEDATPAQVAPTQPVAAIEEPASETPLPPADELSSVVPVAPVPVPAPAQANVPWYKRELSFKSKSKSAPPPQSAEPVEAEAATPTAPAPTQPLPAKTPSVPFYKRELSFGKKSSIPVASSGKSAAVRQKALVGVKIGASGISAARVVPNDGRPELLELVRDPLPRGVVVAGEVRDVPALATALASLFNTHGLPKKAVRLGVSNNRIGVRIIEISGVMEPRQLENAIRFRAQEVLPIALEDAVLDYQQLSESVNADGELVRRVLLVVAYRDLIDRYVVAFKDAGVRLVGIDLEAFGLLRALTPSATEERADAAHVVVSIGHERSTFAVSDGRICEFTRVLEWGGSTLDVAIARQLNLAPSEAEPIKHAVTLDGSEITLPPDVTQEQVNLAADIVRRQLQTFARELVSSLQYYQNQPGSLGIGDIVIAGGTSLLPGLDSELQRLIGVSVRVGDPFERVRAGKGVEVSENQRALAIAIGLAIEE